MISYSVIHLTSPFPDFQRFVNLSAALEVSVTNNFLEFFHIGWNIGSCWIWILRNGCNCDNSWGAKHLSNRRVQFPRGNNGKSCPTSFLILMRFHMLGEMITPHKPFRTLWTFKSLFTCKEKQQMKLYIFYINGIIIFFWSHYTFSMVWFFA